jgi:hypothetical protein
MSPMNSVARGVEVGARQFKRAVILEERCFVPAGVFRQGGSGFPHTPDDLILHVGDVHDVIHLVPLELEVPAHQIRQHEGLEIPDVGEVMNRRTAAVHPYAASLGIHGARRVRSAASVC